ncbi:hypothetical protein V2I01_36205 [Micromonospora sp. BRA006-A]|nr:hypothetical protein [Micromonospora sp. BRA006-A]
MNPQILVTGGTGTIGRHVVPLLRAAGTRCGCSAGAAGEAVTASPRDRRPARRHRPRPRPARCPRCCTWPAARDETAPHAHLARAAHWPVWRTWCTSR